MIYIDDYRRIDAVKTKILSEAIKLQVGCDYAIDPFFTEIIEYREFKTSKDKVIKTPFSTIEVYNIYNTDAECEFLFNICLN